MNSLNTIRIYSDHQPQMQNERSESPAILRTQILSCILNHYTISYLFDAYWDTIENDY